MRTMPATAHNNEKPNEVAVVKKMRDYSDEPAFKKKVEKAMTFLKKHGLPKDFTKKKK
jgi:hypothetical protein